MYDSYIVKPGDTLNSIASKLKTSKEILEELNGYNIDLTPGMILIIPKTNNKYFDYYKVMKGDTLYKIAENNKILAILRCFSSMSFL